MKQICFRCKKGIDINKDNYYERVEKNKGKLVGISYTHRTCWDEFLEQLTSLTEARGMLKAIKGPLVKMGILPPEVVEIK